MPQVPVVTSLAAPPSGEEQALMDLSVTLAHRIRGLVAGIEGYTDLLANTLGTTEQREMALRIFEGAARIERVLADLQLYGQPLEPVFTPVEVTQLIEELLNFLDEPDAERVTVETPSLQVAFLHADPVLLKQVLLSLLKNALDATKSAGAIRIVISGGQDAPVRFDVWNDGHIDLDGAEERVFIPFFTTKAQNIGIGLPIARRIAQAHGGELVLAENHRKKGTCFSLFIPPLSGRIATIMGL